MSPRGWFATASVDSLATHPTRFIAAGYNGGALVHVYAETKIGNRWLPLETTVQGVGAFELAESPTNIMIQNN